MSEILIQCQDVWKSYGKKEALRGLNLQLESGKIVGLLGPNGSGKTTLIKILNGLLRPERGSVLIDGQKPGSYTKSIVSYLPDKPYFANWMKVEDLLDFFEDFYEDFDRQAAERMCSVLRIDTGLKMKTLSKGTKEKVQLILVMSRKAKLYLLDEPIAGVDPAARDFILSTILNHYNPEGTVLISTHLISDVEQVLNEVVFIQDGQVVRHANVEDIRQEEGKSVDELFRDEFRTEAYTGGDWNVK
jgi:ABC-2 type transport system ATP-binding protein